MNLSVIICTHNPRRDYLERTLNALKTQTLPKEQWELLLIDNASKESLANSWDLSWHPHARHVREDELGLTPARLRGIKEFIGELLVFVDDDNVLAADYLEQCLKIAEEYSFLGVWGGNVMPEFETPPPPWLDGFRSALACVEVIEDRWSNLKFIYATMPPGAGMCLRGKVAKAYQQLTQNDPARKMLGRRGESLISGDDTDMALAACDIGMGTGQFVRLKMTHLIPASRMSEDYILKLMEGIYLSSLIVGALHGHPPVPYHSSPLRAWLGRLRRQMFWGRRRRALFEGQLRARQRACEIVSEWRS